MDIKNIYCGTKEEILDHLKSYNFKESLDSLSNVGDKYLMLIDDIELIICAAYSNDSGVCIIPYCEVTDVNVGSKSMDVKYEFVFIKDKFKKFTK